MKGRNISFLILFSLFFSGCIFYPSYPVNPPLNKVDNNTGYRFKNMEMNKGNSDATFVILTLSGGGTRAAAFSYGVINELNKYKLQGSGATLLDEVDIISSVSGGSFASAYYAVYGKERFLNKFPEDVLALKIERNMILQILAPWNLWRLSSWKYGRSDLADQYYGKQIFDNKSFKDLERKRPFVVINATDISLGAGFSFIQDHFDRLCSDLDNVSISRAVTASSAFPVAFTPVTLKNYPKGVCNYKQPMWIGNAKNDLELNASRYDRAIDWEAYEESGREFIHLSDGGLADNIGLRGPVLGLSWVNSPLSIIPKLNILNGKRQIERIVIIAVDAQPKTFNKIDKSDHPPGIFSVLNASATTPMENYSSDTIEQARTYIAEIKRQFKDAGETSPVEYYFSRITFEAEKDEDIRRQLQEVNTKLQLPPEQVALLIKEGGRLLHESPDFKRLCKDIGITSCE